MVSSSLACGGVNAEEIRRLIQRGKDRGLIRDSATAAPIEKDGTPATAWHGVRSQWMQVDPATAQRWLENNFRNRPISDDVVAAYARDMTNGVWVPTHQGVAFSDRDELIDGQHRLHAIIRAGQTIRMMVTFGLPAKIEGHEMTTMDAVDRGRTRSVADQLKIQHGMKDGTIIAAICATLGRLCYGQRTRRLSVGQTLEIYRASEEPITFVIANRTKLPGVRSAGVLAGFAFALAAQPGDPIDRFYCSLQLGEFPGERSPMRLLLTFLTSDDAKLLTRGTDLGVAELTLQAIHQQLTNTRIAKLELAGAGALHFRNLQVARADKIAAIFKLPQS